MRVNTCDVVQAATCALLPPLFFLQFLFYTDVVSLVFVTSTHLVSWGAACNNLRPHRDLQVFPCCQVAHVPATRSKKWSLAAGCAPQALCACGPRGCSGGGRAAEQRRLGSLQSGGDCHRLGSPWQ
jgi:DIE2/ALG10 family